jgi:hypothetical protein
VKFDGSTLTTPEEIDKNVASFCRSISSAVPVFIDVIPELWCRQGCCEMNVEKLIQDHGGNKIIGYKIWYVNQKYIEAERHVVYENNGVHRDPTFNTDGEQRILFVPDPDLSTGYEDRPMKLRRGLSLSGKRFAKQAMITDRLIVRMSNEESWEKMLTYKDWLAGNRMPNVWDASGS